MKKITSICLFSIIITLIFNINSISAEEKGDYTLIEEYEEDVTGDHINETIKLYGIFLSSDSNFYRDIYALIETKNNQKWEINYIGGYNPKLEFIDITQNGINEILFQSATGRSNELYNYTLHTIQHNELNELELPFQSVSGAFINDFQAELYITSNTKPIIMDLKERAEEYIRSGIYNEHGNLPKRTSLLIDSIAFFEPLLISKSKGYGLKSYQQINGIDHDDPLGTIETLWYYQDDDWIILQTDWKQKYK
ncbi:MAG TPA: hypothetical protein VK072_03080 [Candidatus Avamphibacillus sp.]|nr:hypothetical protein [Candidatus Avamphibacillus sp.]